MLISQQAGIARKLAGTCAYNAMQVHKSIWKKGFMATALPLPPLLSFVVLLLLLFIGVDTPTKTSNPYVCLALRCLRQHRLRHRQQQG